MQKKLWLKHLLLLVVFTLPVYAEEIVLPDHGICAHRGENGVFPENAVIGFEEAVRLGAAMVEFDVRKTKDEHLIIMHDTTVDRTTNGQGKTTDLTFDEIRKLDAGSKKGKRFECTKIPTLEEALDCLPRNIWINVHTAANPAEVARIIVEKKREHQAFMACGRKAALEVKEKYPQVKICNMDAERKKADSSEYARKTIEWKNEFLQFLQMPTAEEIKALKDAGVRINYFSAKNPEHYKELRKAGIDFPLVDNCGKFVDAAKE